MPLTLAFIISFFVTLFASWKIAREKLYHERVVFDSVILTFFGALIGARLLFVLFHFSDFGFNILRFIVFGLYPGFSVGGAFLGIAVVFWVLSDKKTLVPFPEMADVITRALRLGVPIFLLGALSGHGERGAELLPAVHVPFSTFILAEHPVTFYKLIAFVITGSVFYVLSRRKVKFVAGIESVVFWFSIVLSYFFIDFFKQFDGYYWRFGVDQWAYVVLLLILVIIILFQLRQKALFITK